MFPLKFIETKAREAKLPFLLIGGHAVNIYAEPRATLDVDLLFARHGTLEIYEKLQQRLRRD